LLAGFGEYLVEQFVRRTAVGKSRVVAFKIVRALDAVRMFQPFKPFKRCALFKPFKLSSASCVQKFKRLPSDRVVALLKLDLAFRR